jgi:hypothetical protein
VSVSRRWLFGLDHFIRHRLPLFGRYEDAMPSGDHWMAHGLLSAAFNTRWSSRRPNPARTPLEIDLDQCSLPGCPEFDAPGSLSSRCSA